MKPLMNRIITEFVVTAACLTLLMSILTSTKAQAAEGSYCHSCYHRSQTVLRKFKAMTGHPKGRKSYVIDHICPLACGGKDSIENLQWQTVKEGKSKDKWERTAKGCSTLCSPELLR